MEQYLSELGLLAALALGIALGLKHSLDPDHVIAVSTIVTEYRNPLRSFWVGVSWGLGHTTTLLLIGVVIILLRLTIPDRLALLMEFMVGIMLVGMGAQVIYSFRKKKVHQHGHGHADETHRHYHAHDPGPATAVQAPVEQHTAVQAPAEHHSAIEIGKPFLRTKSYLVGTVHGVAGSAALTLLVLTSIESAIAGLTYILLFGLGSVLGMGVMTIFVGLPFAVTANRMPRMNDVISVAVGIVSIAFGVLIMYEIGFAEGLF